MKHLSPVLFGLLLALLLLAGCRFNLGSASSWTPGHAVSSYTYMDGPESHGFDASAGQVFSAEYSVTVRSGALRLIISDPGGKEIWSQSFTRDGSGKAELVLAANGHYLITADADQTSGGFDIEWSVK